MCRMIQKISDYIISKPQVLAHHDCGSIIKNQEQLLS